MPIKGLSIDPALARGGGGFELLLLVVQWLFYLSGQYGYGSNHPTMAVAVLLRRKYLLPSSK